MQPAVIVRTGAVSVNVIVHLNRRGVKIGTGNRRPVGVNAVRGSNALVLP